MEPLATDWQSHWQKAQEHDVTHSIIVGTALDTSRVAIEQAQQSPHLFAAPGIHPYRYEELISQGMHDEKKLLARVDSDQTELAKMIPTSSKVVALGETGLDYFRLPAEPQLQQLVKVIQQQAFIAHINLAQKHRLPLLIHVRDRDVPETPTAGNAYWDVLYLLRQHAPQHQTFILHCISGPKAYLKEALNMGAYIGVAANVTYKSADAIRELVRMAPADRLLLETDAPFLPPQEFRGQQCDPWMISKTAEFLEEMGPDTKQIYQNTLTLFPQFLS